MNHSIRFARRTTRRFHAVAILAGWLALAAGAQADALRLNGTGSALGGIGAVAEAYAKTYPDAKVAAIAPSMGSGGAIKALLAGALDIAASSRPLNDGERSQGATETVYAKTPFVIAVRDDNKIKGITQAELAAYYSGRVTAWPDGGALRVILRPLSDSASVALRALSPEMAQAVAAAHERKGMLLALTDQDSASAIEKTPGALGTSSLALIVSEKRALRPLALDGAEPSLKALEDGRYPHAMTFTLVLPAHPSAEARRFADFLYSPAGQAVLRRTGHIAVDKR